MNPSPDISTELKKSDSKELNSRQKSESPNPTTPKKATSPKELQKSLSYPIERELNTDFSLSFKEIYNMWSMFLGCSDDLKMKIKSENKNIRDEAFN